jgi:hypothetical protein
MNLIKYKSSNGLEVYELDNLMRVKSNTSSGRYVSLDETYRHGVTNRDRRGNLSTMEEITLCAPAAYSVQISIDLFTQLFLYNIVACPGFRDSK